MLRKTSNRFPLYFLWMAGLVLCAAFPLAPAKASLYLPDATNVLLNGSGITVTLTASSTLVSYSVDTTSLTLNLDADSSVTVKSNDLYTPTNSQSLPTQCSSTYSYVSFTATGPTSVTVTPTTAVACTATSAPVISAFEVSPASITTVQSSSLSWTVSGASFVSVDNGVGSQASLSSGSATVSPTQTTTYTLTASNYLGTTTAQTTLTVSAPSGGGGGGGGGPTIAYPTINFFSASPPSVTSGQSSVLSWSLTGASLVGITPAVGTGTLSSSSGTATVIPLSTTVFTLTASNSYGQSVTATTTVSVIPQSTGPESPPSEQPSVSEAPVYCLLNNQGTYVLILGGIRHGIANPGLLFSHGYTFTDAIADTAAYQSLPTGDLLGPNDGSLVKTSEDPTVYLVADDQRHGFTAASVFRSLGYKFTSVLTVPEAQLRALPEGQSISSPKSRHLRGANIISRGTIYFVGSESLYPYPSMSVFNSWNLKNDLSKVLPANAADLALPVGNPVTPRTSCAG